MKDYFDINRTHYFQNNLINKNLIYFDNYSHIRYAVDAVGSSASRISDFYQTSKTGTKSVNDKVSFSISGTAEEKLSKIGQITRNNPNFRLTSEAYAAIMNNDNVNVTVQEYSPQRRNLFVGLASLAAQIAIGVGGGAASGKLGNIATNRMAQDVEWMGKHPNSKLNVFGGADFIGGQIFVEPSNKKVERRLEELLFTPVQKKPTDVKIGEGFVSVEQTTSNAKKVSEPLSVDKSQVKLSTLEVQANTKVESAPSITSDIQGVNIYRANINAKLGSLGQNVKNSDAKALLDFAKIFNGEGTSNLSTPVANMSDKQFTKMADIFNKVIAGSSGSDGKTELMTHLSAVKGLDVSNWSSGNTFTGADLKMLANKGLLGDIANIRTSTKRDALINMMTNSGIAGADGKTLAKAGNRLSSNNLELNMDANLKRLEGSISYLSGAKENQLGVFTLLDKLKSNPLATVSQSDLDKIQTYFNKYQGDLSTMLAQHNGNKNAVLEGSGVKIKDLMSRFEVAKTAFGQLNDVNNTNKQNVVKANEGNNTSVAESSSLDSISQALKGSTTGSVDTSTIKTTMSQMGNQVQAFKKQFGENLENAPQQIKDFVGKFNQVTSELGEFNVSNANKTLGTVQSNVVQNLDSLASTVSKGSFDSSAIKNEGSNIKASMLNDLGTVGKSMGLNETQTNQLKVAFEKGDTAGIQSVLESALGKEGASKIMPTISNLTSTFNSIDSKVSSLTSSSELQSKANTMIDQAGSSKINVTGAVTTEQISSKGNELKSNLVQGLGENFGVSPEKLQPVMTDGKIDLTKVQSMLGTETGKQTLNAMLGGSTTDIASKIQGAFSNIDKQVQTAGLQSSANSFVQTIDQANQVLGKAKQDTGNTYDTSGVTKAVETAKSNFIGTVSSSMGVTSLEAGQIVEAISTGKVSDLPQGLQAKAGEVSQLLENSSNQVKGAKLAETLGISTEGANALIGKVSSMPDFNQVIKDTGKTSNIDNIARTLGVSNNDAGKLLDAMSKNIDVNQVLKDTGKTSNIDNISQTLGISKEGAQSLISKVSSVPDFNQVLKDTGKTANIDNIARTLGVSNNDAGKLLDAMSKNIDVNQVLKDTGKTANIDNISQTLGISKEGAQSLISKVSSVPDFNQVLKTTGNIDNIARTLGVSNNDAGKLLDAMSKNIDVNQAIKTTGKTANIDTIAQTLGISKEGAQSLISKVSSVPDFNQVLKTTGNIDNVAKTLGVSNNDAGKLLDAMSKGTDVNQVLKDTGNTANIANISKTLGISPDVVQNLIGKVNSGTDINQVLKDTGKTSNIDNIARTLGVSNNDAGKLLDAMSKNIDVNQVLKDTGKTSNIDNISKTLGISPDVVQNLIGKVNSGTDINQTLKGTGDNAKIDNIARTLGVSNNDAGKLLEAMSKGTSISDVVSKAQPISVQSLMSQLSTNVSSTSSLDKARQISSNLGVINNAADKIKSTSDVGFSDSSIKMLHSGLNDTRSSIVDLVKSSVPIQKIDELLKSAGVDITKLSPIEKAQAIKHELFTQGTNLVNMDNVKKIFGVSDVSALPPQIMKVIDNYNFVNNNVFNAVTLNDTRKITSSSNSLLVPNMTDNERMGRNIQRANNSIQSPNVAEDTEENKASKLSGILKTIGSSSSFFMSVSQELFTLADKLMKGIESSMDGTFLHEDGASAFQRISGALTFAEKEQGGSVTSLTGDLTSHLRQIDNFFQDRTNDVQSNKKEKLYSFKDSSLRDDAFSKSFDKIDDLSSKITSLTTENPNGNKAGIISAFQQLSVLDPQKANGMLEQLAINPNTASLAADVIRNTSSQMSQSQAGSITFSPTGNSSVANIKMDDATALNLKFGTGGDFTANVVSIKSEQNPNDNGLLLLVKNSKTNTTDIVLFDSKKQLDLISGESQKKITLDAPQVQQAKENTGVIATPAKGSVTDITASLELKKQDPSNIQATLMVKQATDIAQVTGN